MFIIYTASVLLISLSLYFFVLPVCKKRPIMLKNGGLAVYLFLLAIALLSLSKVLALVVGGLILLFLCLLKPWFIYGITAEMIVDTLNKSALATRANLEKVGNIYNVGEKMEIKVYTIGNKIKILSFNKYGRSQKNKLIRSVFGRFIMNYYI
jgi:hypothetical protein